MKTFSNFCILSFSAISTFCQAQTTANVQTQQAGVPPPTPYAVVSQDANSKVWESTTYEDLPSGQVVPHLHHYTELATGLSYQQNGQWVDSQEQINIQPDGTASATAGQHQAYFPSDIGNGTITLVTPDGLQLQSQPLGLFYDDGTNTVMIAELTNSVGQLISPNQAIYTNAFTGLDADLLYTYTKAGFEQDVILNEQPQSPEYYGLNPQTAQLQMLTEFFNPPQPAITTMQLPEQAGVALSDDTLDFGTMKMILGRAFLLGTNADDEQVMVGKQWLSTGGRQFLVEAIPMEAITDQLSQLPAAQISSTSGKYPLNVVSAKRLLPSHRLVRKISTHLKQVAQTHGPTKGLLLDYQTINGSQTNFTFQGDTTYYISSPLYLYGTNNNFEGGAVLKYGTSALIDVEGSAQTMTDPYRPAIFTSANDNSVGETISGSTGNPTNGSYNIALEGSVVVLNNLRISYAHTGIDVISNLFNVQVMNCDVGCLIPSGTVTFENALFENDSLDFRVANYAVAHANNVTFSIGTTLQSGLGTLYLTNCILANVTNTAGISSQSDYNGFYDSPPFGVHETTNTFYPFQTVGGGSYYFANGCAFTNSGTANIDTNLLAELAQKTVWPPIVVSNITFSVTTNFSPIIPRDTNAAPAIGYHYDPLDYVFGDGVTFNTNVTVNAGTALGWFEGAQNLVSTIIWDGSSMEINGTATSPCWFVRYNTVQEQPNSAWATNSQPGDGSGVGLQVWGPLTAQFTKWTTFGSIDSPLSGDEAPNHQASLYDCEIYNGLVETMDDSLYFTNCLFSRVSFSFDGYDVVNANFTLENCTLWGGSVGYGRTSYSGPSYWVIENSTFDNTSLLSGDDYSSNTNYTFMDYNAFLTNADRLPMLGAHDVVVTNANGFNWQSSWFGDFYLSTNSPLILMGSTNANYLGLYHFTTQTNQTVEGTNLIDIGYHYVATDTNGNPICTPGDGIPDYIADANGNGIDDPGETPWDIAILSQPQSTNVVEGQNVTFSVAVGGTGPFTYQWLLNSNAIAGATSANYTVFVVPSSDNGNAYSVIVSNADGHVTSSNAVLNVTVPPIITTEPTNLTVNLTSNATFLVSVSSASTMPLGYQWLWNGNVIAGATSDSLTISDVQVTNVGYYSVLVTNAAGTNISTEGSLTVTLFSPTFTNYLAIRTNGETIFYTNSQDGPVLELTPSLGSQSGSAFLTTPINLVSNASFSTYFSFRLSKSVGAANAGSDGHNGADGIAFCVQTLTNNVGSDGGGIGFEDITNSVGVVFDTWYNDGPSIWDPQLTNSQVILIKTNSNYTTGDGNHVGVVYNGYLTNAATFNYKIYSNGLNAVAEHVMDDMNNSNQWYAWIDYNGGTSNLEVRLSETNSRPVTPTVTNTCNLLDFIGKTNAYVGFTAGTGADYNQQDVITWQFISPYHPIGVTNTPSVTIISPTNYSVYPYGAPIVVEAAASEQGGAITNVEFFAGTNLTATNLLGDGIVGANGAYYFAWTNALPGTNFLEAMAQDYGGLEGTSTPVVLDVSNGVAPLSVTILSPINLTFNVYSSTVVTAEVTNVPALTPPVGVKFFAGTNMLGGTNNPQFSFASNTNGVYQAYWSPAYSGTYVLTAEAVTTNGFLAWSQSVTNFINGQPSVTITTPVNNTNLGSMLKNIPISISVTPASGAAVTNVSFYTNGIFMTNLPSPYSFTWSGVGKGVYTLAASATDTNGATGFSSNVTVTVDQTNQPPFVYAGPYQVTNMPSAQLSGVVSDDGLPTNYLSVTWSLSNGPPSGIVHIDYSNQPTTLVTFNTNGNYYLQLQASDGQLSSTSLVEVTVYATNSPPIVFAGMSQTVLLPLLAVTNPLQFEEIQPVNITNVWISEDGGYPLADAGEIFGGMDYLEPSNSIIFSVEDNLYDDDNDYCFDFYSIDSNANVSLLSNTSIFPDYAAPNTIYVPYNFLTLAATRDASGGFKSGEVFSGGLNPGEIMRMDPDGTISESWGILTNSIVNETTNEGSYVSTVCVDQTGVWGGDIIAITISGDVWRVNSFGQPSLIATNIVSSYEGEAAVISGITTIPDNAQIYGPWAGRILVTGYNWYTIDTNGFVVTYNSPVVGTLNSVGPVAVIPKGQNLYSWAPSPVGNSLWSIAASEIQGMAGDIVEYGTLSEVNNDPLTKINWNGNYFNSIQNLQFNVNGVSENGFTFCPAGVSDVPPIISLHVQLDGVVSDDGRLSPLSNYWHEVTGPAPMVFDDPTQTNTFAEFTTPGTYVLSLASFDGQFTSYSNVEITVLANQGLGVIAGANQFITSMSTTLNSTVTDTAGITNQVALTWSQISGPGTASFNFTSETTNLITYTASITNSVSFPVSGDYVLQVFATDGRTSCSNDVTISVESPYILLSPGYGYPSLTNTPYQVTATLMDSNNIPVTNTGVLFFINGANGNTGDPTAANGSNTTLIDGTTSFTYAGTNQGRDLIIAVATIDGQTVTNAVEKDWAFEVTCGSTNSGPEGGEGTYWASDDAAWGWTPESICIDTPTNNSVNFADYYVFHGTAGDSIALTLQPTSQSDSYTLLLRDPSSNCVAVADTIVNNFEAYSELNYTLKSSGDYLIEVVNLLAVPSASDPVSNEGVGGPLEDYTLGLSCNGDTNGLLFAYPELEVLYNGSNITSGGTIALPSSIALDLAITNTLVLSNSGPVDFSITSIQTNGDFAFTNQLTVVPAGGSTNLGVVFKADDNGPAIGQLVLYGNIPVSGCFQAYLTSGVFSTNPPPAIIITSPRNLAQYYAPAFISVTATITTNVTRVASLTLEATSTNGTTVIGTVPVVSPTNSYSILWPYVPNGSYSVFAIANNTDGSTTTSPAVSIQVYPITDADPPPVTTNVYYDVQINSINNILNPLAQDYDPNSNSLAIVSMNTPPVNGSAEIVNNGLAISYTPNAGFYSQSVNGVIQPFDQFNCEISNGKGGLASQEVTVYVYPQNPPIVTITNPPAPYPYSTTFGTSVPITATITNVSPTNIANVNFYVDGNLIGMTNGNNNGSYTWDWTALYDGNFYEKITAQAFDILGEVGVSSPVTITVSPPTGATTASLDYIVGSWGTNFLNTNDLITIRDGAFAIYGKATNAIGESVNWQLGVYSSDGSTLIRDLTPSSTGPVGTATSSGLILGICDLTSIQNGVYDLRLTVIGGGSLSTFDQPIILESNLKIGEFSFSQQDLVIPVNGIPLTVTRTYNSIDPDEGDFGYGWTYTLSDMDVSIDENRETVGSGPSAYTIRTGGGRDVTLTLPNGQRTTFYFVYNPVDGLADYAPIWKSEPGVTATLTAGPNSAPEYVGIEAFEGGQPFWEDLADHSEVPDSAYDFPSFILTTADGTQYLIKRQDFGSHNESDGGIDGYIDHAYGTPYLAQITTLNTNIITINSNSITYSAVNGATNQILFHRNSLGLISSISDPNGIVNGATNGPPAMVYQYDNNDNLLNVLRLTDRSGSGTYVTNTFTYTNAAFPHYITGVIDADGTQLAKNVYDSSGQLVEVDDAYGDTTSYIHDLTNDSETIVDPLNHPTTYVYDTRGNIIIQTNALGQISTMAYDNNNNKTNQVLYQNGSPYSTNSYTYDPYQNVLLTSTDPLGHTNGFTYNNLNEVLTSSDAQGNTSSNLYDGSGNLLIASDAIGDSTTNVYNGGFLMMSTDPMGVMTTNSYDAAGNLIMTAMLVPGAILSSNTYTYDNNGNRLTSTVWRHAYGNWTAATTTNFYDAQNRVIETINPDGGSNATIYDPDGRQLQTIDPLGHTTSFVYDALGRLIETTNADQTTTSSAYDAAGNRTNSVDQLGRTTTYEYDALNRLEETIYPDGATNATVYDDVGRVARTIDARGTITANAYDLAGRRTAVTNAFGISGIASTNSYTYDPNGNQLTFADANGHTTTNVYDSLNRQVQVEYPDGTTTGTVYDGDGRSVTNINQDGILTRFAYDGAGRLITVTNALSQVTHYQYDEAGNETAQIDALGRTNFFFYDGQGRRTLHTMPGGQSEGFAYDLDGNQIYETNFNGAVITNEYDENNRLTNVSSLYGYNVSFEYSATGQRTSMVDPSGAYTYAYDLRDRLLRKTVSWDNGPNNSLNYVYDPDGNVTNIYSSTPNGVDLIYAYDPLNRLTNVLANGNASAAYAYDFAGNLQTTRYGNNVTNLYQYDSLNRLTNAVWKLSLNPLANFSYLLGSTGTRTNMNEYVGGTNRLYTWQYDNLYRLTNENESSSISPSGNLAYQYDSVGNRTNRVPTSSLLGVLTNQVFSFNTNDWLSTDKYDNNGNTTNSANNFYQYDVMNHLTNAGGIMMTYDGDGNRVSKTVSGTTTYYLVDDQNPSGYAQVLEEWTNNGTPGLSKIFNYGLSLISQCQPGTSTNYFIFDGHGSTRMLVGIGGNTVNVMAYDAYGNLIASNGVLQTGYLYSGQQYDFDLGLYYNRARLLNANTGRFWTQDSIDGNNEDPLSLHKYLYAQDDPVDHIDPSGHDDDIVTELATLSVDVNINSWNVVPGPVGLLGWGAGPDITWPLQLTLNEVADSYTHYQKKATLSDEMFNPYFIARGWDISPLADLGHGAPVTIPGSTPGWGPGKGTVQLRTGPGEPKVYWAGAVNYALWGKMFRLSKDAFPDDSRYDLSVALAYMRTFKTIAYGGLLVNDAAAFVRFGYDGTDPSAAALPISSNPSNVPLLQSMEWNWGPLPY